MGGTSTPVCDGAGGAAGMGGNGGADDTGAEGAVEGEGGGGDARPDAGSGTVSAAFGAVIDDGPASDILPLESV